MKVSKLSMFQTFLGEGAVASICAPAERVVCAQSSSYHTSVLLEETVEAALGSQVDSPLIVDGTFGGGGHTRLLLKNGARVIAIDRDPEALAQGETLLKEFPDTLRLVQSNFANVRQVLADLNEREVDGIIADLGVSSRQLDAAERGFSFQKDGPLDMRMGPDAQQTASDLVNTLPEEEIARILYIYGEEKASRRIAQKIAQMRLEKPFERTLELADLIASCVRKVGRAHPATRSFQALRIAVNGELDAVEQLLEDSAESLRPGGRLAIITFHSLEDRLVKHFLRERSAETVDRPEWPAPRPNPKKQFDLVSRKSIVASADELGVNPRSRSARLRVAERSQNQ